MTMLSRKVNRTRLISRALLVPRSPPETATAVTSGRTRPLKRSSPLRAQEILIGLIETVMVSRVKAYHEKTVKIPALAQGVGCCLFRTERTNFEQLKELGEA